MEHPVFGVGDLLRSLDRHLRPHRWSVVALMLLTLLDLVVESCLPLPKVN